METVTRDVYFEDVRLQMEAKLWGEEYNRHRPPKQVLLCVWSNLRLLGGGGGGVSLKITQHSMTFFLMGCPLGLAGFLMIAFVAVGQKYTRSALLLPPSRDCNSIASTLAHAECVYEFTHWDLRSHYLPRVLSLIFEVVEADGTSWVHVFVYLQQSRNLQLVNQVFQPPRLGLVRNVQNGCDTQGRAVTTITIAVGL